MADWTSGYITEIAYFHGYHAELKPLLMRQALLSKAVEHRWGRPLRYLELGFGQGLSLNIHAAAMQGEFWGCDFNPEQAGNGLELAEASGANARILDSSFEELAQRSDLPTFDIIALHGIWSWISQANRRVIIDIARRHLAVGGIFYVSYNTIPGWSPLMPLRHLIGLHAEVASGPGHDITARLGAALDFAQSLADANAAYFRLNPRVADRLGMIRGMPPGYAVHEYLTADSHPMAFSEMARHMADARLSFAATTYLLDHPDALHLTAEQQKLMQGISHPVLRESVRDYVLNQQFRRDLWVKGPRTMDSGDHDRAVRSQRYVLATAPHKIPFTARASAGEIGLQDSIYRPVIEALAEGLPEPRSLAQLIEALPALTARQVGEAVLVLSGMGHVMAAQGAEEARAAGPACGRLNAHLLARAVHSGDIGHLASPVAGGGISVNRFEQLFLRALKSGKTTPAEWVQEAWAVLSLQGERLAKAGRVLETVDENIAELAKLAGSFETERIPILRALQVL